MAFNFDFESYDFENPEDYSRPYKKYSIEVYHFPMMSTYRVTVKEQWWQGGKVMADSDGNLSELTECEYYEGTDTKKANKLINVYLEHISKTGSTNFLGFTVGGDIADSSSEAYGLIVHEYDPSKFSGVDASEKVWLYGRSYTKK